MSPSTGETTHLLRRLGSGDEQARERLIEHAAERLRRLASRMLKGYPGVGRWEQTDDVWQNALLRLHGALKTKTPQNSLHFNRLASLQIRRELIDLARHHAGAKGQGAKHHHGPADDPDGVLCRQASRGDEPSSAAEWSEFYERVESLPEEERKVFDLLHVQEMTQEEAAQVLGVSIRTVKRLWRETRGSLARMLQR